MSQLLQDEVVAVTGASRGLGECLALSFAKNGATRLILIAEEGAKDQLEQTQEKCKSEASGCDCECLCCDLADPQAVQGLADQLAGTGVTCLVSNAGVFVGGGQDPLTGDPNEWDRMMKINAQAPMRLIRALAPTMAERGRGTIICIGDVEGWHFGPQHAAYAASKFALRGFCASTYETLRSSGVRVMNISAGNVSNTAMAAETEKPGGQGSLTPADIAEAALLPWHCSANCVPQEIVLKGVLPQA